MCAIQDYYNPFGSYLYINMSYVVPPLKEYMLSKIIMITLVHISIYIINMHFVCI